MAPADAADDLPVLRNLQSAATSSVPFANWDASVDAIQYIAAFLIVLLAVHPLALFFPRVLKLPLVTGYLILGIIAGPFVTAVLSTELVDMLSTSVNAVALSFISFQAGQEMYLPELRPQLKGIIQLILVRYVVTMVLVTGVLLAVSSPFFYGDLGESCQLAIALMFASSAVLVSPGTIMAIKIELNCVGPFTNIMLGSTMAAEFVVLVSFSVARIVSTVHCADVHLSTGNLIYTGGIVLSNLVVGGIVAVFTILVFLIPGGPDDDHSDLTSAETQKEARRGEVDMEAHDVDPDNAPHPHNAYIEETEDTARVIYVTPLWLRVIGSLYFKGFVWLFGGYAFYIGTTTISQATSAAYGQSWEVNLEPLLVLIVGSCIAGHYGAIRHDMHVILDFAAPYIFLPFFVMTGAALKLNKVVGIFPMMSMYVILRYIAIFVGCYIAGRFVLKLPPRQYNNLWLTMTPQAGVALGLANEVKELSSASWAADWSSTIVAAVIVNQIIGPVCCAIGVRNTGESQYDRLPALQAQESDNQPPAERERQGSVIFGRTDSTTVGNGDPRALLPFYRVQNAVVIGEDEVAFEVALELSLYGAQVNVPLLDEELAKKWHSINDAILARSAKGELISYKNKLQDRKNDAELHGMAAQTDVVIFTGDPARTLQHVIAMQSVLLGDKKANSSNAPRMIAIIPDCIYGKQLKDRGVLIIQPSIAMANIATRMALLEDKLAESLSNEISTTSNFSTAAYFMRRDDDDRDSIHSLSELRLGGRRLALGRSVVNHQSVAYDRLAEALAAENLPLPPPPSRVSVYGTSAAGHDPFARRGSMSAYEHFALDDDLDDSPRQVFDDQYINVQSPMNSTPSARRLRRSGTLNGRSFRRSRRSRFDSENSSTGSFRVGRSVAIV